MSYFPLKVNVKFIIASVTNINEILKTFGIKNVFNISKFKIRKRVIEQIPPLDWRGNMNKELLYVLDGDQSINMEVNELKYLDIYYSVNYICIKHIRNNLQ